MWLVTDSEELRNHLRDHPAATGDELQERVVEGLLKTRRRETVYAVSQAVFWNEAVKQDLIDVFTLEDEAPLDRIQSTIKKLHNTLGHPAVADLIRVLRHGGAGEAAIRCARELRCDICAEKTRPKVRKATKIPELPRALERVHLDVKWLPGWKPRVNGKARRVQALNCVDEGTRYQLVVPSFQPENGQLIRNLYRDHWKRPLSSPLELVMDPAKQNVHQAMLDNLGFDQTRPCVTAGEANWQLGICESHGKAFEMVPQKTLSVVQPQSQEGWLECVVQTNEMKNRMIKVYGHSPCQALFGKELRLPGCLLEESCDPVSNSLRMDGTDTHGRAHFIRETCRRQWIEYADQKCLRTVINHRPRPCRLFAIGDIVCVWRKGKGSAQRPGLEARWHGQCCAVGREDANLWLSHGSNLIRAAPEQVRMATEAERLGYVAVKGVRMEISEGMGLLQKARAKQANFDDLVGKEVHPMQEESVPPMEQADSGEPKPAPAPAASSPVTTNARSSASSFQVTVTEAKRSGTAEEDQEAKRRRSMVSSGGSSDSGIAISAVSQPVAVSMKKRLQATKESRWATIDEIQTIQQSHPGTSINAVRFTQEPKQMITPRPYLEPGKGSTRWAFGLDKENGKVCVSLPEIYQQKSVKFCPRRKVFYPNPVVH